MRRKLKQARLEAGLTQQQLADKIHVGVRQYQRIESGESQGNFEVWDTLEDVFSVHQRVLRENYPDKEANQEKH